ncbi:hypothetical protein [Lysobacter terrae]
MEADETRIVLNLGGGQAGAVANPQVDVNQANVRGRRFVGGDAPRRTQMRRNPDNLLRMVVGSEPFRRSGILISTDRGEIPARDFFVPLESADRERHVDTTRAFWGIPRYTNLWNGVRIFNAGPRGSLGVELADALLVALVEKYQLGDITELRQKCVMFVGRARITARNSFMMTMADIHHVGVINL